MSRELRDYLSAALEHILELLELERIAYLKQHPEDIEDADNSAVD